MFKLFKFGCLGIVALVILMTIIGFFIGDTEEKVINNNETDKVDKLIDANQFSRISAEELVDIMGEPNSIEDYEWRVPKTGESIVGKLYIYEDNKYEFILFDNQLVRLNVYSGSFMWNSEEKFTFENEESIFKMFNISPNEHLKKVVDNNLTLRYTPVSDKVAEVWIQEIENNQFEIAKITYNLNYF